MVFSTLKMSSTRKIVIVFLHFKILSTWKIYTSVQVFFQLFHWRIYTFVRVDKNGVFYTWKWGLPEQYTLLFECFSIVSLRNLSITVFPTLKYVLFPRNVHLCVKIFSLKNICLWYQWTKMVFLNLKCFLPKEYTPLSELTKLKILHTRNIFTSVCLHKNGVFCSKIVFYFKNIHPCANIFQFCSIKNIPLCASWLKWCFLHLKMLSTQRIYTFVRVFFLFFSLNNIYLWSNWIKWCF